MLCRHKIPLQILPEYRDNDGWGGHGVLQDAVRTLFFPIDQPMGECALACLCQADGNGGLFEIPAKIPWLRRIAVNLKTRVSGAFWPAKG